MSKSDKEKSQRLEELRAEIQHHDKLYYRQFSQKFPTNNTIRKTELDNLQTELDPLGLFAATEQGEELDDKPDVGDDRLEAFASHRHFSRCSASIILMMKKSSFEFDQRLQRIFGTGDLTYVVEPKLTVLPFPSLMKKANFTTATTRGNGIEGDIVTQNILHITGLPRVLSGPSVPELIEIRGEIFMSHQEFERINTEREKRTCLMLTHATLQQDL